MPAALLIFGSVVVVVGVIMVLIWDIARVKWGRDRVSYVFRKSESIK